MLFRNEYAFLSNMYECKVEVKGIVYPSAEHAFQACKVMDDNERRKIALMKTASEAKAYGKKVKLRSNWNEVKDLIMYGIVKIKFSNSDLRRRLLATGNIEIVEENYWHDTYWGICNGIGENKLGKIIMRVRSELL